MRFEATHAIQAHVGAVHVARYNAAGRYLLTGGADQQVCLWNAQSGAPDTLDAKGRSPCIQRYSSHSYEVLCLDIAPDSAKFVSGGSDRAALLWDVGSGNVLRRFSAHYGRINDVKIAGDGNVLFAAGADKVLRAYDLRASGAWRPIMEQAEAKDSILSICVSDAGCVHTGSVDGVARTYDMRRGVLRSDVIDQPITSVEAMKDGAALLLGTLDSTIRLIDMNDGSELQHFRGHRQTSFRCHAAFAADEALVFAGDEDGRVHAWDVLSARRVAMMQPDFGANALHQRAKDTPISILWTEANPDPSVRELVSASSCGTVHTWAER